MRPITHEEVVALSITLQGVEGVALEDDIIVVHVRNETAKKEVNDKLKAAQEQEDVGCDQVRVRI